MSSLSDKTLSGSPAPARMTSSAKASPDVGFWRSLEELQGKEDPNVGAEFLPEQLDPMDGTSRRRFLQIMGASVAMASAVGCTRQHRYVVPAARGIEGRTIGQTQGFATAMEVAGCAIGLLAQSYEGRPIRLDGNPLHPLNKGAVNSWAVSSILGLYDPDRSKTIQYRANSKTAVVEKKWDDVKAAFKAINSEQSGKQGEGIRVLSEASSSITLAGLKAKLLAAFPKAQWLEYEPVGRDYERLGTKQLFGAPLRVHYDLTKAEIILDLEADLLGLHPASLQYTRDFTSNRNPEASVDEKKKAMYNRLYCVESNLSTTGGSADHRLAWRTSDMKRFVVALAGHVNALLKNQAVPTRGVRHAKADKFIAALAKDLVAHKGKCAIAVGFRHAPEVHALVHDLNFNLGNTGVTALYYPAPEGDAKPGYMALADLAKEMDAGKVNTLFILGSNPVYTAPFDLKFALALLKVPNSIHIGQYYDETAANCTWHLPQSHYLEAWSDARAWNGTHSIVQPLIEPLFKSKSQSEYLSQFLGTAAKSYDLTLAAFKAAGGTDETWKKSLRDGVIPDSTWKPVAVKPATSTADASEVAVWMTTLLFDVRVTMTNTENNENDLEGVFVPDSKVFDGRFTNNAWLQELPDFITKLTWDNAVLLSYATADKLKLKHRQMANVTLNGQTIKAPIYIQPGQADDSATLILGYGRRAAGVVGGTAVGNVSTVGFDFNSLRHSNVMDIGRGMKLTPLNEWYEFASTQEHSQIDTAGQRERDKRDDVLVRTDTLAHYSKERNSIKHKAHELPLIELFENPLNNQAKGEYKWGMAIDLSKCTGCNACVVACQSENNIPVVGKAQVIKQREMHWLRIDRYFNGDSEHLEDVTVVHQPMMCVHCENAPCEQVCPVAATVHSVDGTNDMVYNRCIGTRYCANNCPFKVRRFNFFNYHKALDDEKNNIIRLTYNPDVTVRSRGVMEKCTYCIQRIRAAKVKVKNADPFGKVQDGDIITACQQACPASAITFGDLNNEASKVTQLQKTPRGYKMLEDLNIKPRTSYLGRIRNPNPELEPAPSQSKEAGHGHA